MRAERRTLLAFGAALAAVGVALLVLAGGARGCRLRRYLDEYRRWGVGYAGQLVA
jgi:hypothetical protein